jgi:hypothetical protein
MRAVSPDDVLNGATQLYIEVYGNLDGIQLCTEFDGETYDIFDRYCMNPGCHCDDVYLHFLRYSKGLETGFNVSLSLKDKKYKVVETFGMAEREVEKVVKHSLVDSGEAIELFKKRYKEMKIAGRISLKDIVQIARPKIQRPDRNAPCPCESGKKYKRCCGAEI